MNTGKHRYRIVVSYLCLSVFICGRLLSADAKGPPNPNPNPPDPSPFAGKWTTQSGKDEEHWYPEFPDNKAGNDNLVNGNFEEAVPGAIPYPKGWAHPDGYCISWITDSMAPEHGKVIMLDTDHAESAARKRQAQLREALAKGTPLPAPPDAARGAGYDAIAGTYGVSFYSEKFKCKPKQAYKVSFDYRGASAGAKVWVRGWGIFAGEERRRYETIVNCYVKGTGWAHFEQAFHPTRRLGPKDKHADSTQDKDKNATYTDIAFLRVMLYAYWPPGQYWFDNIKVEEISDEEYKRLKAVDAYAR
jgi:hypothetical protein